MLFTIKKAAVSEVTPTPIVTPTHKKTNWVMIGSITLGIIAVGIGLVILVKKSAKKPSSTT